MIVEGVGISSNASGTVGKKSDLSRRVEQAMVEAVQHCYDAGVTDPAEVNKAMMDARRKIKDTF
jgi:hypothetical protein